MSHDAPVRPLLLQDPFEELLLGPTFATYKALSDMKLQLSDVGVIEFHEAFAGQVPLETAEGHRCGGAAATIVAAASASVGRAPAGFQRWTL